MEYNESLCKEKHKAIHDRLDEHEELLKEHSKEIIELREDSREYKTEIKNLIKKMDDFMGTIKWGLGVFVTVAIFVIGLLLKLM